MAEFSMIDEGKAPAKPAPKSQALVARMREYEDYVRAVKKGQAGKLTPSSGETARGLMRRASAAGRRIGKDVTTWQDGGLVYFTVR